MCVSILLNADVLRAAKTRRACLSCTLKTLDENVSVTPRLQLLNKGTTTVTFIPCKLSNLEVKVKMILTEVVLCRLHIC